MNSQQAPATEVRFSPMGSRHHTHHLQLRARGYLKNGPWGFPGGSVVKNTPADAGNTRPPFPSMGREDPLQQEMAAHSSVLAWRIPWTEEPGGLQSRELQKSQTQLSD